MVDRRNFVKRSATAAAVAVAASATAAETRENPSGIAGYSYRLPRFKGGSRLLFQGDSITDMKWGRNQADRNHYLGHSYVYLIASRLGVDMPEAGLDIYNRGMSGHTVSDLRKRWEKDAIDLRPDLLSILIGTNDVNQKANPVDFENDYRHILDASLAANEKLRLVLLDPFVLRTGKLESDEAWIPRRAATDALSLIVSKLAKDYSAVHIKTQEIFDSAAKMVSPDHWIWDGVHPLPQGHELIARNWLERVSERWP